MTSRSGKRPSYASPPWTADDLEALETAERNAQRLADARSFICSREFSSLPRLRALPMLLDIIDGKGSS